MQETLTSADVEDVQDDAAAEEVAEEESAAEDPDVDLVYDGVYDAAFYGDYESYIGGEVTVSAEVDKIVSKKAFTIAGTDDTSVEHQGQQHRHLSRC